MQTPTDQAAAPHPHSLAAAINKAEAAGHRIVVQSIILLAGCRVVADQEINPNEARRLAKIAGALNDIGELYYGLNGDGWTYARPAVYGDDPPILTFHRA